MENDKENTLHENDIENSFILGNQKIIKKIMLWMNDWDTDGTSHV